MHTLEDKHSELSELTLSNLVPVEVRQLFETAKNLSLYLWFVYRFHQVSELIAYSALEMALRERYRKEVSEIQYVTLGKLLKYAEENNWIENQEFGDVNQIAFRNAELKKILD